MLRLIIAIVCCITFFVTHAHPAPQPEGMVYVPAGEFIMGADETDGIVGIEIGVDAIPRRKVFLKAFYMDKYETTNLEYKRFIAATGTREPQLWGPIYKDEYPPVLDNDPASDMTWFEAEAYCKWRSKRLPTEEEWEKAARGTDGRKYPWGNEWKDGAANTDELFERRYDGTARKYLHTVVRVGSLKQDVSPYGAYDMAGNVMEWTSSWYKPYPGSELGRESFGEKMKVMRGGGWLAPASPFAFTFNRHIYQPDGDDPYFGIRCAKDAE